MSEPYWSMPEITCPYCKAKNQDAEDLGNHPDYLSGTCSECERDFSLSVMSEQYFNENGEVIK